VAGSSREEAEEESRDCRGAEAGNLGREAVGESRNRREEEEMNRVGAGNRGLGVAGGRNHLEDRTDREMAALEDRTAAVTVAWAAATA